MSRQNPPNRLEIQPVEAEGRTADRFSLGQRWGFVAKRSIALLWRQRAVIVLCLLLLLLISKQHTLLHIVVSAARLLVPERDSCLELHAIEKKVFELETYGQHSPLGDESVVVAQLDLSHENFSVLDSRVKRIEDANDNGLSGKLHAMDENLVELKAKLVESDGELVKLDGKLVELDEKLAQLGRKLAELDGNLVELGATSVESDEKSAELNGNLVELKQKLIEWDGKLVKLDARVRFLQESNDFWLSGITTALSEEEATGERNKPLAPGQDAEVSRESDKRFPKDLVLKIEQALRMIKESTYVARTALEECTIDKAGRRDFAFLQTGGSVIASLTSKSVASGEGAGKLNALGIDKYTTFRALTGRPAGTRPPSEIALKPGRPLQSLPEIALLSDVSIGTCWAFSGSIGQLAIALSEPININAVTIQHIGKELAQDSIKSAPKDFELWSLAEGANGFTHVFLFRGFYDISKNTVTQTFEFESTKEPYAKVLLKINSNYGHPDFTCVYRVRIHGVV